MEKSPQNPRKIPAEKVRGPYFSPKGNPAVPAREFPPRNRGKSPHAADPQLGEKRALNEDLFRSLWARPTVSAREISRQLGISQKTVSKVAARLGLPPRHGQPPRREPLAREEVERELAKGDTIKAIALRLKRDRTAVAVIARAIRREQQPPAPAAPKIAEVIEFHGRTIRKTVRIMPQAVGASTFMEPAATMRARFVSLPAAPWDPVSIPPEFIEAVQANRQAQRNAK